MRRALCSPTARNMKEVHTYCNGNPGHTIHYIGMAENETAVEIVCQERTIDYMKGKYLEGEWQARANH